MRSNQIALVDCGVGFGGNRVVILCESAAAYNLDRLLSSNSFYNLFCCIIVTRGVARKYIGEVCISEGACIEFRHIFLQFRFS